MSEHEQTPDGAPAGELSPRDRVAQGLSGFLSDGVLEKLMGDVLALEKQVHVSCPSCRKRVEVAVPDAKAVVSGLTDLLREGYGAPNAGEQDRNIVVNREVVVACDSGSPCQCGACQEAAT